MEQVSCLRACLLTLFIACAGCTSADDAGSGGNGSGSANGSGGSTSGVSGGGSGAQNPGSPSGPGFVTARRLNRPEYNNTVRDLLGTTLRPADEFPADGLGAEFDTVGSALSLSPTYVAEYEKAAHALVADLFAGDAARLQRIVTCDIAAGGDTCAQTILQSFARRAWRRPVTAEEVQTLMTPIAKARELGASATDGLRHALAAVLLSPFFIFKLEVDPDPSSTTARSLNPHELATRLSYALWSSMPDDALSAAADGGQLETDAQLTTQIDRMLADSRAEALLDTFAARWLEYDHLGSHQVDATKFPQFTPALASSMQAEARRFVQEFLQSPLPVSDMLRARFTFVDAPLATHYGLPAPAGGMAGQLTRVETSAAPRAGLLTLGAFLTWTSLASRTSAVKRGEFVFNRLLCETVPPPPPNIPSLPTEGEGLTLRQRLEEHRKNPDCSGCHNLMDPLGFGLENYDAIGRYQTAEDGIAIDASGVLPGGRNFNGAIELGGLLADDPRFLRCMTQKFMTFSLGRLMLPSVPNDVAWIDQLTEQARGGNKTLKDIIRTVLLSSHFRNRVPSPGL